MTQEKRPAPAWLPAQNYTVADVTAIKALALGEASADQQKRALAWILNDAAQQNEIAFRSDEHGGERETSFLLGRQFVAAQVRKLIGMPGDILQRLKQVEQRRKGPNG